MTEIGEMVAVAIENSKHKDVCPFCDKAPHDFPSKKAEPTSAVESIPANLQCARLPVIGVLPYATAAHHLISAKQCYAKLRRLVQMGSMVGYDINAEPNGISLPTIAKNIAYTMNGKGPKSFGEFDPPEQRKIAFGVMDNAKAQWHVGHHAVKVSAIDGAGESDAGEDDEALIGHVVSYDESVIKELLKLLDAWEGSDLCKEPEDKSGNFIKDMDTISDKIRSKLNQFATPNPMGSFPYFVSRRAHEYALDKRKR
jgi:hypothetical protein